MATNRIPSAPAPQLEAGLPFIPYVRVSDKGGRDGDSYSSPDNQLASIHSTARRLGVELVDGAFVDEDQTGSNFKRPAWERALGLIADGRAAGIIAYSQSRLSRAKTADTLGMVEDVEAVGGRLYDEHGQVSVQSADNELMTTVKAMIDRREWRQRRHDRMTAVANAIGRGVHLGVPFGYQRSDGKGSPLAILEHEARQVRRMFELRADGATWPAIAAACNEHGPQPRPYSRDGETQQARWTHKTVRQIVLNRVYTGVAFNGDHQTADAHEPIVTVALFERANRTKGTKPQGPDDGYLLTGLVRCHGCGYAMTHRYQRPNGRVYVTCRPQQHGEPCPCPAGAPAADLEAWVVERFKADYLTGENEPIADGGAVAAAAGALELASAELTSAYRERRRVPADAPAIERDIAEADVEEARALVTAAERELHAARMLERGADLPIELDSDLFDRQPLPEQRHLLSLVYAGVVVRATKCWREPAAERAVLLPAARPALVGAGLRRAAVALTV